MPSDYVWIGLGLVPIEQVNSTVTIDKLGVVEATLEFTCNYDNAAAFALSKAVHPNFPWLVRSNATCSREEANLGRVRVTYKGISPQQASQSQTVRTYAIEGCLSTEPIESHPSFSSFGGTNKDDAVNGAIFDDDGVFQGFSGLDQPTDVNKRKTGVRSYMAPSLVLTETIVTPYTSTQGYSPANVSSMAGLGSIQTPPTTNLLPQVHGSRTWLLWDVTVEDLGNGTRETRRWRLSGPRGWDTDIYSSGAINP